MHSLMGWFADNAVADLDSPCPSCPKAEAAWRAWFAGGADVPLAALRDRLVADGWTADRYIGFFQAMSKAQPKSCGESKDCSDCPSKGACEGKECGSGCGSCPDKAPEQKDVEPEPAGTAAK